MSSSPINLTVASSPSTTQERVQYDADRRESRLRLSVAVVMLLGVLMMLFGMAWDGQWHAAVGRDRFLTPPHVFMYTGAAAIGLLCLTMVLAETVRYYRQVPGVNDQTTSKVLWIFHAPLGFIITGFGMAMIVLVAPLDNYWHVLYGIDVTVWSPFHIMGLLSGLIAFLGIVYLFGSEATRIRQRLSRLTNIKGSTTRPWWSIHFTELLLVMSLVFLLPVGLITAIDDVQFFRLGPLQFPIYPLVATLSAFILVGCVRATKRIGTATLAALLFTLIRWGMDMTIMPAVSILARQEHLFYRATAPHYVVFVQVYPAFLVVGGLLVDAVYWVASRIKHDSSWVMTVASLLAGGLVGISIALLETPWHGDLATPSAFASVLLASLPLAFIVGMGWGWLGDRFAISVRLLDR